jgi:hypothetical protein
MESLVIIARNLGDKNPFYRDTPEKNSPEKPGDVSLFGLKLIILFAEDKV